MILGIDVSHYDETVDWALLKKNGVEFAIRGFALSEARQRLRMSILGEGDEGPRGSELAPPSFLVNRKTEKPLWAGLQSYKKPKA